MNGKKKAVWISAFFILLVPLLAITVLADVNNTMLTRVYAIDESAGTKRSTPEVEGNA